MNLTPDELKKIHQALVEANGSRSAAAKLLGMEKMKLRDLIRLNQSLRARWGHQKQEAPTQVELMSGEKPPERVPPPPMPDGLPAVPPEEAVERALDRDNRMLRRGLESLRLKPDELELSLGLQAFNNRHFTESFQLIGAGVTRQAIKLISQAQIIEDRLDGVRAQIAKINGTLSAEREAWLAEEDSLSRRHLEICGELRKMGAMANDYAVRMALLRFGKPAGMKPAKKPGFQEALEMPK